MNAKEIAQWVIDNRYPKSENNKMSDFELYHELVIKIESSYQLDPPTCKNCKHIQCSKWVDPCYSCLKEEDYPLHERIN